MNKVGRPKKEKETIVTLYPPKIEMLSSDRFTAHARITWGNEHRDVHFNKELINIPAVLSLLSTTLLELSETKPYTIS